MDNKKSFCFQIENVSVFIVTLFLFFYSLGIFIYSIINVVKGSTKKLLIKNNLIFEKYKGKLSDVLIRYDSIDIKDDVDVNIISS